MKKRFAVSVLTFLFVLVFSCFAQTKVMQKQVQVPAGKMGATTHSVVLTWTAPTTCVDGSACAPTGYNVYKFVGACPTGTTGFTKLNLSPITVTTYTDPSISPGTYCYYATALNSAGESTASNTAPATLAQPLSNAPTNFTVVVN